MTKCPSLFQLVDGLILDSLDSLLTCHMVETSHMLNDRHVARVTQKILCGSMCIVVYEAGHTSFLDMAAWMQWLGRLRL